MVSGFSVEDMRKATEYCGEPLPNSSQGYFTINRSNNCQVALFKFKVTAGCRATASWHHFIKLPLPNPIHKSTMFGNLLDIKTTQDHHQVCPFTGGVTFLFKEFYFSCCHSRANTCRHVCHHSSGYRSHRSSGYRSHHSSGYCSHHSSGYCSHHSSGYSTHHSSGYCSHHSSQSGRTLMWLSQKQNDGRAVWWSGNPAATSQHDASSIVSTAKKHRRKSRWCRVYKFIDLLWFAVRVDTSSKTYKTIDFQ